MLIHVYQIISDDYNLLFQAYYDTDLQIRARIEKLFSLFLVQTYAVGTQKNCLIETVLLSTQNTCLD